MQIKNSTKLKLNNNQSNHNGLSNEKKVDINILLNRVKSEKKNLTTEMLAKYILNCFKEQ